MGRRCYDCEELEQLHVVLESLLAEAKEKALQLDDDDIIEQLFDLAEKGEKNFQNFRDAIFGHAA